MDRNKLIVSGVNYDRGLERLLNDSELYEELLSSFLDDKTFALAEKAYYRGDYAELFEQGHTLKGVAGNLDMTALYASVSALTEYLRHNREPDSETLSSMFEEVRTAYQRVIAGIAGAVRPGN